MTSGGGSQPINQKALDNPDIDGISLGMKWTDFEPTKGNYKWTYLDTELGRVKNAGKKALLRINTGGVWKPDFVMAAVGSDTFTYVDNSVGGEGKTTIPVLWNQPYLDAVKAMLTAMGERYTNNSALKVIVIGFGNAVSMDWAIPATNSVDGIEPSGSTPVSRWMAAGYTHAKMVDAAAQIINAGATAFPNQNVYFSVGEVKSSTMEPQGTWALCEDVVANARGKWGTRVLIGNSALNAVRAPSQFDTSHQPTAGQAVWKVTGDTGYRMMAHSNPDNLTEDQILRKFFDNQKVRKWIEVYEADCVNPALSGAIKYGHELLTTD